MLQAVQWDEEQSGPVASDTVKSLLTALSVHNVVDDLGLKIKVEVKLARFTERHTSEMLA